MHSDRKGDEEHEVLDNLIESHQIVNHAHAA